jgi:hypothetical protein
MCGATFETVSAVLLVCDPVPDVSKERSASIFMVEQAKFLTLNVKTEPTFETPSESGSRLMLCGFTQSLRHLTASA